MHDLSNDISESLNVADQHPEVVQKIQELAETMREQLVDALTNRLGSRTRESSIVDKN